MTSLYMSVHILGAVYTDIGSTETAQMFRSSDFCHHEVGVFSVCEVQNCTFIKLTCGFGSSSPTFFFNPLSGSN